MKTTNTYYRYSIAFFSSVLLLLSFMLPLGSAYAKSDRPTQTEVKQTESKANTSYPLNINTADAKALSTIPGIGKNRAEAIVAYRDENGSFKTVEGLAQVRGISTNFVDKHREYIMVK